MTHLPLITIDLLIEHLNELREMKLQRWQTSSLIGAMVVRQTSDATGMSFKRESWEDNETNIVGVVLPVAKYRKLKAAADALDTLFSAMDALGEFERFEVKR